jgi:hypothetical protein
MFNNNYDAHCTITLHYAEIKKIESPDVKMHLFMILGLWRTYLFDAQSEELLELWLEKIGDCIKTLEVYKFI